MNIWATSDQHFGHKKMAVLRGYLRALEPGDTWGEDELRQALAAHDDDIIGRYNSCVGERDTVYHVGDFSFHNEERSKEIFKRLKGQKILVTGNHDRKRGYRKLFQRNENLMWFKALGHEFEVCHFPMLVWNKHHRGAICLHGHSHGTLKGDYYLRKVMDVGVDCHSLYPVNLEHVVKVMATRIITTHDHHTYEGDE